MGFFDFISKAVRTITEAVFPRQFIEPEIKEYRRKIIKVTGYSKPFEGATGKEFLMSYALTYEDSDIDRSKELKKELIKKFGKTYLKGKEVNIGYDEEYIIEPEINYIYPNIKTGNEETND
jgi:hypothetical protein